MSQRLIFLIPEGGDNSQMEAHNTPKYDLQYLCEGAEKKTHENLTMPYWISKKAYDWVAWQFLPGTYYDMDFQKNG